MIINSRLDFHEWNSTSYHWLHVKWWVPIASVGGLVPSYKLRGMRYGSSPFTWQNAEGLVLATFARIEKWTRLLRGASKGCDIYSLIVQFTLNWALCQWAYHVLCAGRRKERLLWFCVTSVNVIGTWCWNTRLKRVVAFRFGYLFLNSFFWDQCPKLTIEDQTYSSLYLLHHDTQQ